jgi:hypothetical protein
MDGPLIRFEIHLHPEGTTEVQWSDGGAHWKALLYKDGKVRTWIVDGGKRELDDAGLAHFRKMIFQSLTRVGFEAFNQTNTITAAIDRRIPKTTSEEKEDGQENRDAATGG